MIGVNIIIDAPNQVNNPHSIDKYDIDVDDYLVAHDHYMIKEVNGVYYEEYIRTTYEPERTVSYRRKSNND